MSRKALENTNEMCSCLLGILYIPWIELIQYGRRIGKKVYCERFERAWSSAVKRKSIISVHRSKSDSKWGSIFVTYRIKDKVLFFKIKEAIKRAWSVSRLFTKRTIFACSHIYKMFRHFGRAVSSYSIITLWLFVLNLAVAHRWFELFL